MPMYSTTEVHDCGGAGRTGVAIGLKSDCSKYCCPMESGSNVTVETTALNNRLLSAQVAALTGFKQTVRQCKLSRSSMLSAAIECQTPQLPNEAIAKERLSVVSVNGVAIPILPTPFPIPSNQGKKRSMLGESQSLYAPGRSKNTPITAQGAVKCDNTTVPSSTGSMLTSSISSPVGLSVLPASIHQAFSTPASNVQSSMRNSPDMIDTAWDHDLLIDTDSLDVETHGIFQTSPREGLYSDAELFRLGTQTIAEDIAYDQHKRIIRPSLW